MKTKYLTLILLLTCGIGRAQKPPKGSFGASFLYGRNSGSKLTSGYCDIIIGNDAGTRVTSSDYLRIIKLDNNAEAIGVAGMLSQSMMIYRDSMNARCRRNYTGALRIVARKMQAYLLSIVASEGCGKDHVLVHNNCYLIFPDEVQP